MRRQLTSASLAQMLSTWLYLTYLKYWTLYLIPLMVYPNVLFPLNFIINQVWHNSLEMYPALCLGCKGPTCQACALQVVIGASVLVAGAYAVKQLVGPYAVSWYRRLYGIEQASDADNRRAEEQKTADIVAAAIKSQVRFPAGCLGSQCSSSFGRRTCIHLYILSRNLCVFCCLTMWLPALERIHLISLEALEQM